MFKIKHWLWCFITIILLTSPTWAITEENTVEVAPLITAVEFRGNFNVPDKIVSDAIFSRVGESLSQTKVRTDIKSIYSLGYFKDVTVAFEKYFYGTKVVYMCVENPAIAGISIEGNSAIPTTQILAIMRTATKKVLNFRFLQEDIKAINQLYQDKGYSMAHVIDTSMDETNNHLTIKILEGKVESIAIEGNELTQNYVIMREIDTKVGDVFNEQVFAKDLRRVYNLGFFSEVIPNVQPGSTMDKIIVVLNVKETRSNTVNFGGGYGEREGMFGFIDLSINNLFGTARGLLIRGQAGQQLQTYQFKYTDPWFIPERLGARTAFSFKRWYTIGQELYISTQNETSNGGEISFGKSLSDELKTSLTMGIERVEPYQTATFEPYDSNTIGFSVSYDTRDFWLNPSSGVMYSLALKQGWKNAVSANTTFFKATPDLNWFFPIIKNQVLALHLGLGAATTYVPISELYWCGGANSVRGYSPSETRIGRLKIIGNIEYRLNFNDTFQGVFFVDFGDAWDTGGITTSRFMTGWGPGVRLNTPLGPIRLDYGVGAGRTFSEGIIHFSIGQAF
ncbi:MAG: BamA/TamA family outer membrane protein [Candidatus Saganbacteria bacterium]|nr:BamA/TamA family outer membrane protein [Candidatus Saganbacteria bacterium]